MRFESAKELIGQFYELNELNTSACQIIINKLFDDENAFFIALKGDDETCFLTDFAKTCELVDISESELKSSAYKFGLGFDNYYVKKEFNDLEDLKNFIMFLDFISENFNN